MLLVSGGAIAGGWYLLGGSGTKRADLVLHKVRYENIQVTITERGQLESADNRDIICRVKARAQGSTVASTIKWIIDDGTMVTRGMKLVELDDSGLQDQLAQKKVLVDQRHSEWIQADEEFKIQDSQTESDIEAAKTDVALANINLLQYLEGQYEADKKDVLSRVNIARSDLEMWQERAGWSDRMSRPGRRYVTASQAESDRARMLSAETTLQKIQEEFRVLEDPKYGKKTQMLTDLNGKIRVAKSKLKVAELTRLAKLAKAEADRKSKESIYLQEASNYRDIEIEIAKCTIKAPQSGLVVYYIEERTRWGQGKQSMIAQGESVQEGQKLMRIPDLDKMVVTTKVHEAMISKVKGDLYKGTGFTDGVAAGVLLTPDPFTLLLARRGFADMRQDFTKRYHHKEMEQTQTGQDATVRVDAFAGYTFHGHVKSVATIASSQDFLSSDVRVYQTVVSIDESFKGAKLKPGMSAQVTIRTAEKVDHVLAVPVQAVIGTPDAGPKRKCFVSTGKGTESRDIVVGLSNDRMVEIKSGLQEGDQVVLNPSVLLTDKQRAEYGLNVGKPDGPAGPGMKRRGPGGESGGQGQGAGGKGGKRPGGKGGKRPGGGGAAPLKKE